MPTPPEVPHGVGLGPNTIQIYADELGLDLSAWAVRIGPRNVVHFSRETALRSHRIRVYPNQSKIEHETWKH
jgi:hypothetical protein